MVQKQPRSNISPSKPACAMRRKEGSRGLVLPTEGQWPFPFLVHARVCQCLWALQGHQLVPSPTPEKLLGWKASLGRAASGRADPFIETHFPTLCRGFSMDEPP